LVEDAEPLLDFTALSHAGETSVFADVDETVLLEDWSHHGVLDDGWRWVRDDTWLLEELLGEEVDTEVTMLSSVCGGGDADHLAWTLLEDNDVTNTDVVAWERECGRRGRGRDAR